MGLINSIKSISVGLTPKTIANQLNIKQSELNKTLLKYVGGQMPVWMNDNYQEYVDKGYMYNPDVYSVIGYILNKAGGIPWILNEVKDEKSLRGYKIATKGLKNDNLSKAIIYRKKALQEVESHRILDIMARPNPLQGQSEWIQNTIGFKLITGNTYVHGPTNSKGLIQELWTMPGHLVEIVPGDWRNPIAGYKIKYDQEVKFDESEIMHLKYWSPDYSSSGSHLYGMSPIKALARVVRVSNDTYTANAKLLQNMGAIGIISSDDEQGMDQEETDNASQAYYRKYGGAENRGKVVVLGSKIKWSQMGMPIDDLGIFEGKKFNLRDICMAYKLPSQLFNDPDGTTYNNMKEAAKAGILNAVLPELDNLRDELNRWMIPAYEKADGKRYYLDYDIAAIPELQEDLEKLTAQLKEAYWLTGDEKRLVMGYDETGLPEMTVPMVPMGLMPLGGQEPDDLEKMLKDLGVREYRN